MCVFEYSGETPKEIAGMVRAMKTACNPVVIAGTYVLCYAILYFIVLYRTKLCNTMQRYAILCYAI